MEFETLINKAMKWTWAALGICCLGGALIAGAWWHLGTTAICALMYLGFKAEEPEDEKTTNGR